jgi:hypothetical protein
MRRAYALCVVSWLVATCATSPPPPGDPIAALRARASSELSCPQELLRISPLGDQTFGPNGQPLYEDVEGCSLHVVYTATKSGYLMSSGRRAPPSLAPDHVDVR